MPNIPKISLTRNQIIMIGIGLFIVLAVIVLFVIAGGGEGNLPPVTLTVWGIDPSEEFAPLVQGYEALRPNATVEYTQIPANGYSERLLTALAAGSGPDVFLIGNHDILARGAILAAAPETQLTAQSVEDSFPQAVAQDFVYGDRVYALPLYMDTLKLAYNKDLLDQAGIPLPPATWQEVLDMVPRLRALDPNGQVSRAAIALGGTEESVRHSTDILSLIMLQNGTPMSTADGRPVFAGDNSPGPQAFRFYLQFANPADPAYTWNDSLGDSIESFVAQKTTMAFVYGSDLPTIQAQAPFLNFRAVPVPQISADRAVNYPSYRGLAVWVGSPAPEWGWDFVIYAATDPDAQAAYLGATGREPALRSLIQPPATAALTARSWKMGDYDKIREIFNDAIQNVQTGARSINSALEDAQAQAGRLVP